eukprot:COSAG05_NODE_3010_length_2418_cov_1.099181_2_plen_558_part_01
MPPKLMKCVGCDQKSNLSYHSLTEELCHLKKLCQPCGSETPNACSNGQWQRAWTTTKKRLEETGDFDKDWPNTDPRYLHTREEARQLALQRAQAAQPAAATAVATAVPTEEPATATQIPTAGSVLVPRNDAAVDTSEVFDEDPNCKDGDGAEAPSEEGLNAAEKPGEDLLGVGDEGVEHTDFMDQLPTDEEVKAATKLQSLCWRHIERKAFKEKKERVGLEREVQRLRSQPAQLQDSTMEEVRDALKRFFQREIALGNMDEMEGGEDWWTDYSVFREPDEFKFYVLRCDSTVTAAFAVREYSDAVWELDLFGAESKDGATALRAFVHKAFPTSRKQWRVCLLSSLKSRKPEKLRKFYTDCLWSNPQAHGKAQKDLPKLVSGNGKLSSDEMRKIGEFQNSQAKGNRPYFFTSRMAINGLQIRCGTDPSEERLKEMQAQESKQAGKQRADCTFDQIKQAKDAFMELAAAYENCPTVDALLIKGGTDGAQRMGSTCEHILAVMLKKAQELDATYYDFVAGYFNYWAEVLVATALGEFKAGGSEIQKDRVQFLQYLRGVFKD